MRDITPYARTAFAQGWAASGGPMTEQVKAGCITAIELACEHADDPHVLEATLHLGHLEGTWALVYDRREKLYTHHIKTITDLWRTAAQHLDLTLAIKRYRQSLVLTETADPNDTEHRRMVAMAIAAAVLALIAGNDSPPENRDAIIAAIAEALKTAQAEGWAGAIAVGADQAGHVGIDIGLAFKDALTALGDLGNYWADATGWLDRIVDGAATDLGNRLSALAADGASFEDMLTEAEEVLTGRDHRSADSHTGHDIRAVAALIDLAIGQSISRGALALYSREAVRTVAYVTAGDGQVCGDCLAIEDENPWPLTDVPWPPRHPRCRCTVRPAAAMRGVGLFSRYTIGGE